MVVPVPNDPQYIAMMRGLLDTLTWSRSFKLHPTEQAARQVADSWAAAFASAEITFQNCEAAMILRQNPANVCQLQQSQDGGETWTLAFDYSLCSTAITVPTPYPGSPTQAADSAAAIIRNLFETLAGMVDCGGNREQFILDATAYLRTFDPTYANPAALGAIYDAACALTPTELDTYEMDCTYGDKFEELSECYEITDLGALLDCLNELLVEWLDETNTALMQALTEAAAALTGDGFQRMAGGGAGGGAGFDVECTWEHVFNAANGWGGFAAYMGRGGFPGGAAVFADGVWKNVTSTYRELTIISPDKGVEIPFTGVFFTYSMENNNTGYSAVWKADDGTETSEWFTFSHTEGTHENGTVVGSGAHQITIIFQITGTVGEISIDEVRLSGTGYDPYL